MKIKEMIEIYKIKSDFLLAKQNKITTLEQSLAARDADVKELKGEIMAIRAGIHTYKFQEYTMNNKITKLEQALAVAVEALNEVKAENHSDLCISMKPYRPSYACYFEVADEALKQIKAIKDSV